MADARYGKDDVVLVASNPIWRGETIGSDPLVLNAILDHHKLDAPAAKPWNDLP